jgi:hypothetical protein
VEEVLRKDIEANDFGVRRGPGYVWAQVDRDIEEQDGLYRIDKTQ